MAKFSYKIYTPEELTKILNDLITLYEDKMDSVIYWGCNEGELLTILQAKLKELRDLIK